MLTDTSAIPQWQFGFKPNTLANLVVAGRKTATCSGYCFYALENQPLPQKGENHIVLDNQNQPIVCIELKEVFFERFNEVTEEFALAEGEGDYQSWKMAHRTFFERELDREIDEHFEVVCERFYAVNIFPKTYAEWLTFAEQTLLENAENNPFLDAKFDANILLQAVTKRTKSAIFAFAETVLNEKELKQLAELLARRANGEPMAYILGEREFWSLPLKVSPHTLIPRPDTERLVELALDEAYKRLETQEKVQILDLGTGTGAIALALASELKNRAEIVGVDRILEAVELAEQNRQSLSLHNVRFLQSDWFSALREQQQHFDIIVSNPPYIDADDENLRQGDVRFEPLSALVAEENGLADLQKIIENAPLVLKQGGVLLLEHGWQQAIAVQSLFKQHQWQEITTTKDYGGNYRITQATKWS